MRKKLISLRVTKEALFGIHDYNEYYVRITSTFRVIICVREETPRHQPTAVSGRVPVPRSRSSYYCPGESRTALALMTDLSSRSLSGPLLRMGARDEHSRT
jgi:hypothetical protein